MARSSPLTVIISIILAISLTGVVVALGNATEDPDVAKQRMIQQAAFITDLGMETAREMMSRAFTENITEAEVAKAIRDTMTDHGSNPYVEAFEPIVASGNDSAIPHGDHTNDDVNLILPGEVVVVDIGARYKGWCADETRTFYIGDDPPETFIEVYEIVKEAHDMGAAAYVVGAIAGDVDAIARNYIADKGYGDNFTHCLGHGMGVYIHMKPMVCPGSTDVFMAWSDQVVSSEPGIYLEGWFGVRIEDDYAITRSGPEQYTHSSDDLDFVLILPPVNDTSGEPRRTGGTPELTPAEQAMAGALVGLVIAAAMIIFVVYGRKKRRK